MIQNQTPPTEFNLLRVAVGQNIRIPLVSNIDVSRARELSLIVTISSATFAGTGANPTLSFVLVPARPTADGRVYQLTTPVVTATLGQIVPTAPSIMVGSNITPGVQTPVGGWVNLALDYTQYATTVTSALVTVSIDLVQKV